MSHCELPFFGLVGAAALPGSAAAVAAVFAGSEAPLEPGGRHGPDLTVPAGIEIRTHTCQQAAAKAARVRILKGFEGVRRDSKGSKGFGS